MRNFIVDVLWKLWLVILASARNKPYPIWSYRTPNIGKTLEKGLIGC
jgi:hypothetical protein